MRIASERWAAIHWPLIAVVVSIAALGIYNLHSAAAARDPTLYLTQLAWVAVGLVLAAIVMAPDYRVTESLAYVAYAVVCLLLVAVLVQGKTAGGAQRWLAIGPATFQPSEIAKLAIVFCLARYYSHRIHVHDGGYSFGALFRPLNPSRPLTVIVMLALWWTNPWLVDPIGEMARFIHTRPLVPPGDLLWLRIGLILAIIGIGVGGVLAIRALERQRELLDPWPEGRRRRLIALVILLCLALGGFLALLWSHPVLRDPFGVALAVLHAGAAPGGAFAEIDPGYGLRVILVLVTIAYAVASALSVRLGEGATVDLIIAPIDLLILPAMLVLVEPDLGTAGILILIGFTIILVVGVRLRSLLIMGVLGAAVAAVAWFGVLKDYQKRRILTFIDPEQDIKGAGWNAVQSMIAVGSGKWWGKGHMDGTQSQLSFLPEQHTDFAFSVWAEEQGFVGCLIVLALYLAFLIIAFSIAANARDTYGSLLAVGVAAIVLWQAVINVGMVIGMMPVVGLTLPLFSYGGSSLLTVMIGVGILLNVHWHRRAH